LVRSLSSSPHPHLSNLYRNIWNIKLASNITLYITHLPVVIKNYFKVYCIKTYLISPFPQSFLIEDQLCLVIRMLINVSSVSIEVRSQQLGNLYNWKLYYKPAIFNFCKLVLSDWKTYLLQINMLVHRVFSLLRFLTFEKVIQLKILNIQTIYTSQLIQRRNTSTHYIRLPLSELNVKWLHKAYSHA
jgi:hypothetical protein